MQRITIFRKISRTDKMLKKIKIHHIDNINAMLRVTFPIKDITHNITLKGCYMSIC